MKEDIFNYSYWLKNNEGSQDAAELTFAQRNSHTADIC